METTHSLANSPQDALPMATLRQIHANRQNAQHSTGPKTDEGKDASRRNALTHGLTGAELLPDDLRDAVQQRMIEWRPNYWLSTPEEEWFFEQLVVNSVRLDRCQEQESALRASEHKRAALCWDEDRRDEAEEIAAALSRRPALISRRLQRTRQGVDWMIERWRTLGLLFERNGEWTDAQTTLALDLTGAPRELRDEPEILEDPAALVAREIARLERRKTQALDALDALERGAALAGQPLTLSRPLKNLRSYEATCRRNYEWAKSHLHPNPQPQAASEPAPQNQTRWDSGQYVSPPAVSSPPTPFTQPLSTTFTEPVSDPRTPALLAAAVEGRLR